MQSFLIPIMYLRTAYGAWFPHQECLHILIRLTNAPQAKACRRIVHLPGGIGEGWCVELKLTVLLETMFHTQCVGT